MTNKKIITATFLPPRSLNIRAATDARAVISARAKDLNLPLALFQVFGNDGDGNRGHGAPVFRWRTLLGNNRAEETDEAGNEVAVEVIACGGSEVMQLLLKSLEGISSALGNAPYRVHAADLAIESVDELGHLVFRTLSSQANHVGQAWSGKRLARPTDLADLAAKVGGIERVQERVADVIQRGITRFAGDMGLCLPTELIVGDVAIDRVRALPLGRGAQKFAHCCVSGSARCNFRLSGPWHIGRGASKGAGYVFTPAFLAPPFRANTPSRPSISVAEVTQ